MGSLQFQLQGRRLASMFMSSHSSQSQRFLFLLKQSRGFRSNSMEDDVSAGTRARPRGEQATGPASSEELFNFSESSRQSSPQRPPPEPIPNRPLRSGKSSFIQTPHRDRSSHRPLKLDDDAENESSDTSPLQFLNRNSTSPLKRDSPSQSDNSFLDRFKLGVDSNNKTNEKFSQRSRTQPAEPQQDKQEPPPDANDIFKKMKETGLIPNAVAMLDGLCKDGLVQEAMKLFGLMREKGTIPEVVIYTAVVDGFCKAQKFDDAIRIFRKMQNNGIIPNAFSYTVLIQGLYRSNQLDNAIAFCVEMLESGHSPNITTFVGLVDGLCNEKGVEEAQSVISTLRQKGFFINDKAVRDFLDKKAPFSPMVWEAIFGKKSSEKPF